MSNLLKKASIITTPTAYDDGRILSVKPNENLYGSELVTNGDFATDTDWVVGSSWAISGGSANCNGTTSNLDQASIVTNTKYKVTITVSNITTGTLAVRLGSSNVDVLSLTENGTYTGYGLSNGAVFRLRAQSGFDGSVDNVSVVEDLSGDFDFERGSAATRVNAQGLVENVQILSSELVQNGNFSETGSEKVSNGDFSQESSELVVNGDFATDSDWILGNWTISGGTANIDSSSNSFLQQSSSIQGSTIYKVSFTISDYTSGSFRITLGGYGVGAYYNANGTYEAYVTSNASSNTSIYFYAQSTPNFSIDNVSVREVGQDWSLVGDFKIDNTKGFINNASQYSQITSQIANNYLISGKTYKLEADITTSINNALAYRVIGGAITPISLSDIVNGKYTAYFTMTQNGYIWFQTTGSYTGLNATITNISVKEVGQDWGFTSIELIGANTFKNTGTNGKLQQSYTSIVGAKYRLSFTINSGNWNVVASTNDNTAGTIEQTGTTSNSGTIEFIATTTTTYILLYNIGASGAEASITNISLLQVTDDTDLPRINYEGFSYQDALGSELITNGNFDTDSNWTKQTGWSISGGKAIRNNVSGTGKLYQPISVVSGKTYKVSLDFEKIGSDASLYFNIPSSWSAGITTSGNHTFYVAATSTGSILFEAAGSNPECSIDNVSVKEYSGQEVVPNSGCGSWLFEPQSTNLVTYSEDFSQWSNARTNDTANQANSPLVISSLPKAS